MCCLRFEESAITTLLSRANLKVGEGEVSASNASGGVQHRRGGELRLVARVSVCHLQAAADVEVLPVGARNDSPTL